MSIQAGWNNALGIVGGLSALGEANKLAEYSRVRDFKKGIREAMGDYPDTLADLGTKFAAGDISAEDYERMTGEAGKAAAENADEYKNAAYTEGMPKSLKKEYDKAVQSEMDYAKKKATNRITSSVLQRMATRSAQEAAQVADTAPKNTMSPIIEQLRKNTANIPTMVKGGDE